jgi:hypothetical protein
MAEKPEIKPTDTIARSSQSLRTQLQFAFFSEDSDGIDDFSPHEK